MCCFEAEFYLIYLFVCVCVCTHTLMLVCLCFCYARLRIIRQYTHSYDLTLFHSTVQQLGGFVVHKPIHQTTFSFMSKNCMTQLSRMWSLAFLASCSYVKVDLPVIDLESFDKWVYLSMTTFIPDDAKPAATTPSPTPQPGWYQ